MLQSVRHGKSSGRQGILVDLIPEVYDGESLGEALAVKLQEERRFSCRGREKAIRSL